jgi:hypothetical protein
MVIPNPLPQTSASLATHSTSKMGGLSVLAEPKNNQGSESTESIANQFILCSF